MAGPVKNSAYTFYCALTSQADPNTFQVNPTLAAGDVTISVDGTTAGNITTLPSAYPAAGAVLKVELTADEMNGDCIAVKFSDAAGSEWQDLLVVLLTETSTISDLHTDVADVHTDVADVHTDVADVHTDVGSVASAVSNLDGDVADVHTDVGSVAAAVSNLDGDVVAVAAQITNLDGDVADVAADVDTILESGGQGGATAQQVWEYPNRRVTMTAAELAAAVAGNDVVVTSGLTFSATLTGLDIPVTWSKIYLTAKDRPEDDDSAAVLQVVESNPGVGTDGVLYLNGATATPAWGGLTVNQGAGTIKIDLTDEATAMFLQALRVGYDVKVLLASGTSSLLTYGSLSVNLTETKALT